MNVTEFIDKASRELTRVHETDQTLPITKGKTQRPYAAVISDERRKQLEAAEDVVSGLLRLHERGASAAEYQAYAEALDTMVKTGRLDVHAPAEDTIAA